MFDKQLQNHNHEWLEQQRILFSEEGNHLLDFGINFQGSHESKATKTGSFQENWVYYGYQFSSTGNGMFNFRGHILLPYVLDKEIDISDNHFFLKF